MLDVSLLRATSYVQRVQLRVSSIFKIVSGYCSLKFRVYHCFGFLFFALVPSGPSSIVVEHGKKKKKKVYSTPFLYVQKLLDMIQLYGPAKNLNVHDPRFGNIYMRRKK
jgi:hypothetical protein